MSTKKKKKYGTNQLEKEIGFLSFGNMLGAYRLSEEMTQRDFSKMLGISPSSLCDLEKARKIPSISRAKDIADTLGLSQKQWVQAAIQDQLKREHLDFEVSISEDF